MNKVLSEAPFIRIEDSFYERSQNLRSYFDAQFENPLDVHENRFVWDFWNVPNQYCHLRTPAYHYFPEEAYQKFHQYLVDWGRENLGCHDISPTWLSCYPEGSFQNIHVDEPHGPLAFVYSLTLNTRSFKGGETIISKEKRVKGISSKKREIAKKPEVEFENLISLNPKFNRLSVFDPSYPHGVSETQGTKDPRKSRLVIHGWFVQPRPFWEGPAQVDEIQELVDGFVWNLAEEKALKNTQGYLGVRVTFSTGGKVKATQVLVSTLNSKKSEIDIVAGLNRLTLNKKKKEETVLTLPLVFS